VTGGTIILLVSIIVWALSSFSAKENATATLGILYGGGHASGDTKARTVNLPTRPIHRACWHGRQARILILSPEGERLLTSSLSDLGPGRL